MLSKTLLFNGMAISVFGIGLSYVLGYACGFNNLGDWLLWIFIALLCFSSLVFLSTSAGKIKLIYFQLYSVLIFGTNVALFVSLEFDWNAYLIMAIALSCSLLLYLMNYVGSFKYTAKIIARLSFVVYFHFFVANFLYRWINTDISVLLLCLFCINLLEAYVPFKRIVRRLFYKTKITSIIKIKSRSGKV